MAAIETDGRVSVYTGADGNPTMPQLNADGSISISPGSSPGNQPVTIADGANVTLGSKTDTAGANAGVANQTAMSRFAGIWGVLGSLTDAAATAWDNTSNSISSLLRGIGGNIAAVLNGNAVRVAGQFVRIDAADFTRPATTGTYANGQVYGPVTTPAVITFTNVVRANGGSGIVKASLLNLQWPSGTPVNTNYALRLKLYTVAPTPIADGALWTTLKANFLTWVGSFDFSSLSAEGATYTGSDSIHGMGAPVAGSADADISFTCASNSRNLYGVLVAEGAFTQVASQVASVSLIVDQN
ncbi:MAG: hypothetical protein WCG85_14650 [Polyangia bacterium]